MRKTEFVPIALERYVELYLRDNRGADREDLVQRLRYAMDAHARGARCHCGEPIWIIGSAEVGLSCFTCITGEAVPNGDYEIMGEAPPPPRRQPSRRRRFRPRRSFT
jgi:hypothetical protein